MPSNRYAEVKIGTIYLSTDGTALGTKARCQVEGKEQFSSQYSSTHLRAADATDWEQIINIGKKSKDFTIVFNIPESVMTSIISLIETANSSGATVPVEITDFPSFTVNARPKYQGATFYSYDRRSGGTLYDVRLFFTAVS